jgi:hypothetical protein
MDYSPDSPLYRLLGTKYDAAREEEGIRILREQPELAAKEWRGLDNTRRQVGMVLLSKSKKAVLCQGSKLFN